MSKWLPQLRFDPTSTLASSGNEAIVYFTKRDLLEQEVAPASHVWKLPEVQKTLRNQQSDGSWKYSGKKAVSYPEFHYPLIQTWKNFRVLVEQYELTKKHQAMRRAAEFLFSCQTEHGDIRGMLANQYATYYTGAMLAHLIRAGYEDDVRVERGLKWLISMRQDDGGWSIPILTHKFDRKTMYRLTIEYAESLLNLISQSPSLTPGLIWFFELLQPTGDTANVMKLEKLQICLSHVFSSRMCILHTRQQAIGLDSLFGGLT